LLVAALLMGELEVIKAGNSAGMKPAKGQRPELPFLNTGIWEID